jgi:hypothetical protein
MYDSDADIPLKNRVTTSTTISKKVDDLVDREVDAKGTPKPHPKSVVNKALNSEAPKKRRIVESSDDDSDDDVPLAKRPIANGVSNVPNPLSGFGN